jgi:hypothetical protein
MFQVASLIEYFFSPKGVTEYKGADNLQELNLLLTSTCMIRRKKSVVLKQLPEIMRSRIVLVQNRVCLANVFENLLFFERVFVVWILLKIRVFQLIYDLFELGIGHSDERGGAARASAGESNRKHVWKRKLVFLHCKAKTRACQTVSLRLAGRARSER